MKTNVYENSLLLINESFKKLNLEDEKTYKEFLAQTYYIKKTLEANRHQNKNLQCQKLVLLQMHWLKKNQSN